VGETPGATVDDARLYTDPSRNEVDMIFQFEHMSVDRPHGKYGPHTFDLRDLKAVDNRWQMGLTEIGWNSLYWNNHDQSRVVSRFGDDGEYRVQSAKMLGAILHMQRGTPYIYQGEEIGMTNIPFASFDAFQDIEARNYYRDARDAEGFDPEFLLQRMSHQSRDNARTPMQWDTSDQAGFTTGSPWIKVNPNYAKINAEEAVADEESVFHFHRKLIQLRHDLPVVVNGDFTMLLPEDPKVYAYIRSLEGTSMLVLGNFSSDETPVPLDDAVAWISSSLLLSNYDATETDTDEMVLRPWETRIYLRD
jgi:oligo-1,6-glucosidase